MHALDLTREAVGIIALLVFVVAYAAVIAEERLHLRKSVPVLVAAGIIWVMVAIGYAQRGQGGAVEEIVLHSVLEFSTLFLFLIVAMTYVNTMEERGLFSALRGWLVGRRFSYRALFWVTGGLAFVLSPVIDNLTTALVMGAVAVAVGQGKPKFITLACINVVVAANAGGAFSPFGDITTLMVWQRGLVSFTGFFPLIVPSTVTWLVPAVIMSLAVEPGAPPAIDEQSVLEAGAVNVAGLFLVTIALTVALHNTLHLPPAVGMMFGLGLLKLYSYVSNRRARGTPLTVDEMDDVFARTSEAEADVAPPQAMPARTSAPSKPLDIFRLMERVEWDTLMFFYGVILAVGGLGALGFLAGLAQVLYVDLGPTVANILIGLLSAIIDNVPVMFAVLSMDLTLSQGQWLLVTLTTGVGGSLLAIGSAAGVALMGQARGAYTFMSHLRWTWAIALGYAAGIGTHLLLNRSLF
jgi:Na+/H+ antiporter NhaD/arsenite permease-like protein